MQSRPITVGLFTHKKINASPKKRCTYWYLGPWNNFQQKIAALTIVWSIWKQALEKKGDPCFWSYCPHTHKIIIMQKKKKSFIFLLLSSFLVRMLVKCQPRVTAWSLDSSVHTRLHPFRSWPNFEHSPSQPSPALVATTPTTLSR